MAQQMHNIRLQGLQHQVSCAALIGAPSEQIAEVIDTSLASDEEKAALRLFAWSFLSRFELRRMALERLRDLSLEDEDPANRPVSEEWTG
jgi:hypothetical protein